MAVILYPKGYSYPWLSRAIELVPFSPCSPSFQFWCLVWFILCYKSHYSVFFNLSAILLKTRILLYFRGVRIFQAFVLPFTVKSVLSGHSKIGPKIGFQDRLSLNAGQKY